MKDFPKNKIELKDRLKVLFFIIFDIATFFLSFWIAYGLRNLTFPKEIPIFKNLYFFAFSFSITVFSFYIFDLYYQRSDFRKFQKIINLILAIGCAFLTVSAVSYLDRSIMVRRSFLVFFYATLFILTYLNRRIYSIIFVKPHIKKTLILGESELGRMIMEYLLRLRKRGHYTGLDVIGYVSQFRKDSNQYYSEIKRLSGFEDIERIINENNVELLIYALSDTSNSKINEVIVHEKLMGCDLISATGLFSAFTGRLPYQNLNASWLIEECLRANKFVQIKAKRVIDIVLGLIFFILTLPISLLCAIIIKLDSKGPVLFIQDRVGFLGQSFKIYKFRTMKEPEEKAEKIAENWHRMNERRITHFGKWMRKLHLDEIPQFVNIIKGDMSIAGPRPEMEMFIKQCEEKVPFYRLRLAVKPGLTGWAQVWFRHTSTLSGYKDKFEYELYYLANVSVRLDLEIILRTVFLILEIALKEKGKR